MKINETVKVNRVGTEDKVAIIITASHRYDF